MYSINNFCFKSIKIQEKFPSYDIKCPSFKELNDSFFEDNNIMVSILFII